ncbi:FAD-binding oxidoreductase [cyanobiont of Ornithocercus magnificus]|nr:FAD-binding oxidoreductase [cyanobiont of Ornithocercus magnificus]
MAEDALVAGVLEPLENDLLYLLRHGTPSGTPWLICSGGTTSRCAAPAAWTLDLRPGFRTLQISADHATVRIGTGLSMAQVLQALSNVGRSIPIGLSSLTGAGYLLTGGLSPLSRSLGLAIDRIVAIDGIWGCGEPFHLEKKHRSSTPEQQRRWRGLLGAAPFLAVVTEITLKTVPVDSLEIWHGRVGLKELARLIHQAENWPENVTLQWFWRDAVEILVVHRITFNNESSPVWQDLESLGTVVFEHRQISDSRYLPQFGSIAMERCVSTRRHSEVVGLLGPAGVDWNKWLQDLQLLMYHRPDPVCAVAAQQIGGVCRLQPFEESSFIHRSSEWKPWITATWKAGDETARQRSLTWLENVWKCLSSACPGVHLAQLHPHLTWHRQELNAAFGPWLAGLRNLKAEVDPRGVLPPL